MAWKSKYPEYPDLSGDALGDFRARIERGQNGYIDHADSLDSDEYHDLYRDDCTYHWASQLRLFVESVQAGEEVPLWLMRELAEAFDEVLRGSPWEATIPLPERGWNDDWSAFSPKERRDMDLCARVRTCIRFGDKVTEAMATTALQANVSYETVRAAYYNWRERQIEIELRSKEWTENVEDGSE